MGIWARIPLALLVLASGAERAVHAGPDRVVYEYAFVRNGELATEFRPLDRTSMLYGQVAFQGRDETGSVATHVQVQRPQVTHRGEHEILCASGSKPWCVVDFGRSIRRQWIEIVLTLGEAGSTSRQFQTLEVHRDAKPVGGSAKTKVEFTGAKAAPPDLVRRLVQVERRGEETSAVAYCDDLGEPKFEIAVAGIRGARLLSAVGPRPEQRNLIPLLFNVSAYCTIPLRTREVAWDERYRLLIGTIAKGLRRAVERGLEAEFLVVPYAKSGRVFGPFALHPTPAGSDDDPRLRELVSFLENLDADQWCEEQGDHWTSDFGSTLHTLNDLYLREFPGPVIPVVITDGTNHPAELRPTYLHDLWPARSELLDGELMPGQLQRMLELLDDGRSLYGEELDRLLAAAATSPGRSEEKLLDSLQQLDPGGVRTLWPHRIDTSPMMNALLVPGRGPLREDSLMEFSAFVREDYGGRIWRLASISPTLPHSRQLDSVGTVATVLETTYQQLRHSHALTLEVPNPRQDGARHDLRIRLDDDGPGPACTPRVMAYYTSSRSMQERLRDYLGNPRKSLRLLAAYEARKWPLDHELYEALVHHSKTEAAPEIQAVMFESWALVNLQRLRAGLGGEAKRRVAEEAYYRLLSAGERAELMPDPEFARRVASLARWYAADKNPQFDRAVRGDGKTAAPTDG